MQTIKLSNGGETFVDDEDYESFRHFRWYRMTTKPPYASARVHGEKKLLHRLITNAAKGMDVDHIDGNGLNNQRANLRVCTHSENMRNRRGRGNGVSKYRGVSLDKRKKRKKWRAYLTIDYLYISLGYFLTEDEAKQAYDTAITERYGVYAAKNQ